MKNNRVNLVTTSLKNLWDNNNKNRLLNRSCLPFSLKKIFENYDYEFGPHPWDNRKNLINDYEYLKNLNVKILRDLSKSLNKLHNTSYSINYWRIALQPWLDIFLHSIFERWINLEQYFGKLNDYSTVFLISDDRKLILNDVDDTILKLRTDFFNHHIYKKILMYKKIKYFKYLKDDGTYEIQYKSYKYKRGKIKSFLTDITLFLNSFLYKKSKFFLIDTYLGRLNSLMLSLKLNSFGIPLVKKDFVNYEYNETLRQKLTINLEDNDFEKFISTLIHKFIPKSYVENYKSINHSLSKLNWPKKPKIIFTAHSYREELILFYIAKKKELYSSKVFFGQHGGSFFQYLFNSGEDYQIVNSDFFFTWGDVPKENKIYNIGILKPLKKIKYESKNKKILFVIKSLTKYTQQINSSSGVNQHIQHINDLVKLINSLKKNINENVFLFRNHARFLGLDEEKIFKHYFPKSEHDDGKIKIRKLYKKSKLIVHTYYSTGILETLALNYPSIVINNFKNTKFRKNAMINIKGLIDVGIIHQDFEKAKKHILEINNNIEKWWYSEKVQKEIKLFCKIYAKKNMNIVSDIAKIFKKEMIF